MTAQEVIDALRLKPHPVEGGFFRETYRSELMLPQTVLPFNAGPRSIGTAIYYLLTPDTVSAMHRLPTDEVFHFYLGDPVEMLQLLPDGQSSNLILGPDVQGGQQVQTVVMGGIWQGSVLKTGGRFALLGATMAPGFDYADYVSGDREELTRLWPHEADAIRRRTPRSC
jgi:hypothetical protein